MTQRSRSSSIAEEMEKLVDSLGVSSMEAKILVSLYRVRVSDLSLYVLPELSKLVYHKFPQIR